MILVKADTPKVLMNCGKNRTADFEDSLHSGASEPEMAIVEQELWGKIFADRIVFALADDVELFCLNLIAARRSYIFLDVAGNRERGLYLQMIDRVPLFLKIAALENTLNSI